jgi:hypothetical protein
MEAHKDDAKMTLLENTEYNELVDQLLLTGDAHDPRSNVIELLGEIANVWPKSVRSETSLEIALRITSAARLKESAIAMLELYNDLTVGTIKLDPAHHEPAREALVELIMHLPADLMETLSAEADADLEEMSADVDRDFEAFIKDVAA